MSKLTNFSVARMAAIGTGAAAMALAAQPGAAQASIGPDAAACQGDGPALIVNVAGFKARSGSIRVNVYGSDPGKFLERGQYVRQINLRVPRSGPVPVCVRLPRPGRYAVAVRHDLTGNGNDWGDGGGFSRNPDISLTNLRPSYQRVAFDVGSSVERVNVVLNYRFGLSIRPVRG